MVSQVVYYNLAKDNASKYSSYLREYQTRALYNACRSISPLG